MRKGQLKILENRLKPRGETNLSVDLKKAHTVFCNFLLRNAIRVYFIIWKCFMGQNVVYYVFRLCNMNDYILSEFYPHCPHLQMTHPNWTFPDVQSLSEGRQKR